MSPRPPARHPSPAGPAPNTRPETVAATRILCIGAMLWDVIGHAGAVMAHGADVPGRIRHIPGGVALNVALAAARQGLAPVILSAVARDVEGEALTALATGKGIECRWLARDTGQPTDTYMAIEDPDGLVAAIADAWGLEAAGAAILAPLRDGRLGSATAPWRGVAVIDGNLTPAMLQTCLTEPGLAGADLRLVPASPGKAERLRPLLAAPRVTAYVNRIEAEILAGRRFADAMEAAEGLVAQGAGRVLVTDGSHAAADAARGLPTLGVTPPAVAIARVTGAGDTLLAAHLAAEAAGLDRGPALTHAVAAAAAHVAGQDMPPALPCRWPNQKESP